MVSAAPGHQHKDQARAEPGGLEAQDPRPRAPGHPTARYSLVVLPDIWMMHLESRLISRELKGRTRTATFTEAPAISPASVGHSQQRQKPQRARRHLGKMGDVN